ncbi:MAG: energy-coupling factor transporter transmembrane protein EcfT [Nitrososphaerota archaeon]|nr:energy-coupling factor transporter transmembrane protein EcfT [Nitrososphaerota archaeon]MDG7010341.1 energy-coupling factor transporter transmembrane protein EcfT [Nitrososphaerota archaeon]MDG7019203.1 energy-coupling factor transporter transmembrane protein EcfT [Nitrososphaerota archaeon]
MGGRGDAAMMWISGGFVFRRGTSAYHKLDPRVKLLISLLMFVATLLVKAVYEMAVVIAFMVAVAAVATVLKRVLRTMAFTALFSAFIFGVNMLATRNLFSSTLYATRFVAIVVSTSLFFITTSPDELEQVMKTFRFPRDIVFAFVTAVRFIPVMMLDTIQIMDAQKSRGLELEKGNILRRVRNMIPILIPLVVNSVVRSGELAEAMESRAYGAVPRPTSLVAYRAGGRDVAVAAAAVLVFALTAYSFYYILPLHLP